MVGLAGEKEVQELQKALSALLHIGVVLDIVLPDVVGNAALVVGVPHITVKIQYDFLVGHQIDPPVFVMGVLYNSGTCFCNLKEDLKLL
jgi:hypothetical protein